MKMIPHLAHGQAGIYLLLLFIDQEIQNGLKDLNEEGLTGMNKSSSKNSVWRTYYNSM